MQRKIILFELNEVPFKVVDQFCTWRPKERSDRLSAAPAQGLTGFFAMKTKVPAKVALRREMGLESKLF